MEETLAANSHPYCVGVGASGPEGLADIIELLNAWPERAHAVLMVVLHRSSEERSSLREVLLTRCPRMRVERTVQHCSLGKLIYLTKPGRVRDV